MKKRNLKAFSLVEISVVIIIIGILIAGVTNGASLIADFRIKTAQSLTKNSPVAAMEDIVLWLETTSKESFSTREAVDQSIITNWYDINPSAALKNNANNPSATSSDHPTYKEFCLNYLPCVSFNGTSNWIDTTRTLGTANEITIFVVSVLPASPSVDATAPMIISAGQVWASGSFALKRVNGIFYQLPFGGPSLITSTSIGAGNYIYSIVDNSDISQKFYVNGKSAISITSGLSGYPKNLSIMNIGSSIQYTTRGNWFNGGICELIVFQRALSDKHRIVVEKYLGQKWGIRVNN